MNSWKNSVETQRTDLIAHLAIPGRANLNRLDIPTLTQALPVEEWRNGRKRAACRLSGFRRQPTQTRDLLMLPV